MDEKRRRYEDLKVGRNRSPAPATVAGKTSPAGDLRLGVTEYSVKVDGIFLTPSVKVNGIC